MFSMHSLGKKVPFPKYFKRRSSVTIHMLPDIILLDIFSRLTYVDLCMCSRVCRQWYSLARDSSLKKSIIVEKKLDDNQLKNLICNHFSTFLEEFQLLHSTTETQGMWLINHDVLWKLSSYGQNLKKLVLMSCSLISASSKELPPNLLHLSVRGSEIYPVPFFGLKTHQSLPYITCLDVGGVSYFLTSQCIRMFSTLKYLRSLYLDGCFHIHNGCIDSIIDILPQLTVLDVEGTHISNEGVWTIFKHCTSIKELYIGHTSIDNGAIAEVHKNSLPVLSTLCIKSTNISNGGLHSFLSHLRNKKITVKADFNFTSNYPSLPNNQAFCTVRILPRCFTDKTCQHYLLHKC